MPWLAYGCALAGAVDNVRECDAAVAGAGGGAVKRDGHWLALGAGRQRLVRMLLTENLILATAAGTISAWLAYQTPLIFEKRLSKRPTIHSNPTGRSLSIWLARPCFWLSGRPRRPRLNL